MQLIFGTKHWLSLRYFRHGSKAAASYNLIYSFLLSA